MFKVAIRSPGDKPWTRDTEILEYRTFYGVLQQMAADLRKRGVTHVVIFVRTQRVPKDCVAIGRRRIVVLDFRYGALGFVAIPGRVL